MGWYISPSAGPKDGQFCEKPCEHKDCAQSRAFVESACEICGLSIGEGVPFYFVGDGIGKHFHCQQEENQSIEKVEV